MAAQIGEMLIAARNWADAHEPADGQTREALFESHLAYLVNGLFEDWRSVDAIVDVVADTWHQFMFEREFLGEVGAEEVDEIKQQLNGMIKLAKVLGIESTTIVNRRIEKYGG